MSRVTVTPVDVGDDVTETNPNATLAAWDVATLLLDGENVALGGIHQRNIAADTASSIPSGSDLFEEETATTNTNASWAQIQVNGNNVLIGSMTVDTDNEDVLIFCSFEYVGTTTVATRSIFSFRLEYSTNGGGAWNSVTSTIRRLAIDQAGIDIAGSMDIIWHVPTGISSSQFQVRLTGQENVNTDPIDVKNCTMFPRFVKL